MRIKLYVSFFFMSLLTLNAQMPNKKALLIGINHYRNLPENFNLRYSEKDVDSLKKILVENLGFKNKDIVVLKGNLSSNNRQENYADYLNIKSILQDDYSKLSANDLLFIYFSGHGTLIRSNDEPDGNNECLLPANAVLGKPGTYIKDDELSSWLNGIQARKILVLDCCFMGHNSLEKDVEIPEIDLKDDLVASVDVMMTASRADETARENPDMESSNYTSYFIQALQNTGTDLNNDQKISVSEIHTYIYSRINNQHPQIYENDNIVLKDNTWTYLSLTTIPSGAKIFLGDHPLKDKNGDILLTPLKEVPINKGIYKLRIEKSGYEMYEMSILKLHAESVDLGAIQLLLLKMKIRGLVTDNKGNPVEKARIAFYGNLSRDIPEIITNEQGYFEFRASFASIQKGGIIEKDGLHCEIKISDSSFNMDEIDLGIFALGDTDTKKSANQQDNVAQLILYALPWADVYIDGQYMGQSDLKIESIAVGTHQIVFKNPQLGVVYKEVLVKKGYNSLKINMLE